MPLFRCTQCGCAENTALSNWAVRRRAGLPALCSGCDPEIGQWHGRFAQTPWNEEIARTGGLPREIAEEPRADS